jgi:hypothetical protein
MSDETQQILAHMKSLVAELNETSDELIRSLEKDGANEAGGDVDGRRARSR